MSMAFFPPLVSRQGWQGQCKVAFAGVTMAILVPTHGQHFRCVMNTVAGI